MVFQSYALYPHMSVRGNIGFGLKMAGMPKEAIRQKVEKAAAVLNLTNYLDRKPRQLSGGQRQRVAIGRAIVREPKAFLFDEPLSNLDAALRVQMRLEIAQLHESLATTMIYVTHDQIEAMTLADKIVVLNGGNIEQAGSPLELYHHPVNLFVAGFIGSPKMNFFATEVRAAGARRRHRHLAGRQATSRFPSAAGSLRPGDKATLGVRPEHLMPARRWRNRRRGGRRRAPRRRDLSLHPRRRDSLWSSRRPTGNDTTRVHEQVALRIDPETCHLFDAEGRALPHLARHPLAEMRPTAPQTQPAQQAQPR